MVFSFPWSARYVADSNIIRYIAADSRKRNAGPSAWPSVPPPTVAIVTLICPDVPGRGPSLVVHTSVPFGLEHLEEDQEQVQPLILEELDQLLPGLPPPVAIKCQKWRYSQVSPDGWEPEPAQVTMDAAAPRRCSPRCRTVPVT